MCVAYWVLLYLNEMKEKALISSCRVTINVVKTAAESDVWFIFLIHQH
jgi:hypothetical protein